VIIPLRHENHSGRRWPHVTIALIALNALLFVVTHGRLDQDFARLAEVQYRTVILAAEHPDAPLTDNQQELVNSFRKSQEAEWDRLAAGDKGKQDADSPDEAEGADEVDEIATKPTVFDSDRANQELIALASQLDDLRQSSVLARFTFFPSRPTLITYITANFLHGGWMHLIFNMWFLWLAGAVLEDVWGRPLYAGVYLFSGMGALAVHALVYPNSLVPVIGASGAIAALMGAFLVRFPKTKIQLGFFYWLLRPRLRRFSWPAYAVLPLWFVEQALSAALAGEKGGVAYWAHIGGFIIGAGLASMLRYSGIEQKVDQAIEAKVGWSADPRIVKAGEHIEKDEIDLAIAELQAEVKEKPGSVQAWEMLPGLYWKKNDIQAYQAALETACRLHMKEKNLEAAWQDYDDFTRAGEAKLPCALWAELCRHAEDEQNWDRAAAEYEKLAEAYPAERAAVLALISAGRIHLRQGNLPQANKLYAAAQASPAPHRDWDETIRKGLEKAGGSPKPALAEITVGSSQEEEL
jgi:membrane associated rhomboid family serine protease